MKTITALLALVLFALPAAGQQSVTGTWRVEKINQTETPEGVALTLAFDKEAIATLTYTLEGQSPQSWDYQYELVGKTLTLEPLNPIGKPNPVEYELRFEKGQLLLLPPKPETTEEEDAPVEDADTKEEGDTDTDEGEESSEAETEADDGEEEEKEEDTREPIWVLVKADTP